MEKPGDTILLIDQVHPLIQKELTSHGFSCEQFSGESREDLKAVIGNYFGVIIRSRFRLDREILEKAKKLKFIGRVGSGLENIDVSYALQSGITCLNSPEGNRVAVGEHASGMLLSLFNQLNRADREVRQGIWNREGNRGIEIQGKTIGIIGYGNTGSAFARCLKGFDANVISYDKYKSNFRDDVTEEVSMDEIFSTADVLSLHVPLTDETRYLVDTPYLNRFNKKILLINTSRGNVVNTGDLVTALKSGKVMGAALDVLEYEADSFEALSSDLPDDLNYLMASDKVILSPHIAGWTNESNIKLAEVLVEKILAKFK